MMVPILHVKIRKRKRRLREEMIEEDSLLTCLMNESLAPLLRELEDKHTKCWALTLKCSELITNVKERMNAGEENSGVKNRTSSLVEKKKSLSQSCEVRQTLQEERERTTP